MSVWQHKGFEIVLNGATFAVNVNGRPVRSSSLGAAKKAIDKHLDAKSKEVALNLPVVMVRQNKGVVEFQQGVITGIDATMLTPVGENLDSIRGFGRASVMPDSEGSVNIYRAFVEAETVYEDAKQVFYDHRVTVNFSGYGRSKLTYTEAIRLLQESYKDACKP